MGIGEYKYKAYGTSNYPEKQQEAERVWEGTRGSIDGLVKILEIEPADSEKHKEALNAMHGYITTNFVITFWSVNEDGNEKYDTLLDDKGLNKYAIC